MVRSSVWYGLSCIHYLHYGKGPVIIIGIHGYGENSKSFLFLEKFIDKDFSVIAIDLPYHGGTQWMEGRAFTAADLKNILQLIFAAQGVALVPFVLVGYSMGGRLAMAFTELFPALVSRLVLLAPDGLQTSFWYWCATQTTTGHLLFQFTMHKPGWIFMLLRIANNFRLINKSICNFVSGYLHDAEARMQLYHRWTCFRKFNPRVSKLRSVIRQRKLPVRLAYGKYDRIILPGSAKRLCSGLESYCQVCIIEDGHQLMTRKHAAIITRLLTT